MILSVSLSTKWSNTFEKFRNISMSTKKSESKKKKSEQKSDVY